MTDSASERGRMAALLTSKGVLKSPWLRGAVETVPREQFLHPGVFLDEGRSWRPVTAVGTASDEWLKVAYSTGTLTTQLDGHLTADQSGEPVVGVPTSSSTAPATVVGMIETLDLTAEHRVLEIGTGTGYSTALMCHYVGEDNVTTVEVDPQVAARADAALESVGYSTWTVTGDGLLGHPHRAPYDRVIATCAVRRIPYTWIRQTKPGGLVLSTVGSWPWGTGLARVTVRDDGTAEGAIIGRSSFMQARAQAVTPLGGDLSARTAYADSDRPTQVPPLVLEEWMPAFLAQLAAPGAQFVRATRSDGSPLRYLFDPERESFAEFLADGESWTVRQGGPVALWDDVERALTAWQGHGSPRIDAVRLRVTQRSHLYWIDGAPHCAGNIGSPETTTLRGMDDEPLSRWAERRDARIGQLRAVPLASGDGPRGTHLNPEAPRAILRWNGHVWEPCGFAANLSEAKRILFPDTEVTPSPGPTPKLGPGSGRHRKPQAPR